MEDQLVIQSKRLYETAKPWRAGLPWWLVGIEGAIALVAGIYVLGASNATANLQLAIAVVLMAFSVMQFIAGLRDTSAIDPLSRYRLIRGGIGVLAGFLVVIDRLQDYLSEDGCRIVLGLGFLGVGLTGLWGMWTHRAVRDDELRAYIADLILVLFGIALIVGAAITRDTTNAFGWLLVVAGVLLLAFGFLRWRRSHQPSPPAV